MYLPLKQSYLGSTPRQPTKYMLPEPVSMGVALQTRITRGSTEWEFQINRRYKMSKVEKKKAKIQERIMQLENDLRLSLQKKSSATEINVPAKTREIAELKAQLVAM